MVRAIGIDGSASPCKLSCVTVCDLPLVFFLWCFGVKTWTQCAPKGQWTVKEAAKQSFNRANVAFLLENCREKGIFSNHHRLIQHSSH